jgi:stringent starvation protein B
MVHPVQSVVESLYEAGRCPRLHVNALWDGVVCPDFIREQWRERLIIDLDANYPLDLRFDDEGIAADLSFGGFITRCAFPWGSIYVVADRATGHGFVLQQNVPASVKLNQAVDRQGEDGEDGDKRLTRLEAVADLPETDEDHVALSGQDAEEADDATHAADEDDASGEEPEERAAEGSADQVEPAAEGSAARRRAAFRVIDGGG